MNRDYVTRVEVTLSLALFILGLILSVIALGAELVGLDLTPGFGMVQMFQLLLGLTLLTIAGYLRIHSLRPPDAPVRARLRAEPVPGRRPRRGNDGAAVVKEGESGGQERPRGHVCRVYCAVCGFLHAWNWRPKKIAKCLSVYNALSLSLKTFVLNKKGQRTN